MDGYVGQSTMFIQTEIPQHLDHKIQDSLAMFSVSYISLFVFLVCLPVTEWESVTHAGDVCACAPPLTPYWLNSVGNAEERMKQNSWIHPYLDLHQNCNDSLLTYTASFH